MISLTTLLRVARSFLGVPWRHRGRNWNGVDCLGLIVLSFVASGWVPRDEAAVGRLDYSRASTSDELLDVLRAEADEVALDELCAGDVLVFRFERGGWPQHVGLVMEVRFVDEDVSAQIYFIHARATAKASTSHVVEHALVDGWKSALHTAFRFSEVNPNG